MIAEDCGEIRDLLASVLDDDRDHLDGPAVWAVMFALDELVDPVDPPGPWCISPADDPVAMLERSLRLVTVAIDDPRPIADLMALAMCARYIRDALTMLSPRQGDRETARPDVG